MVADNATLSLSALQLTAHPADVVYDSVYMPRSLDCGLKRLADSLYRVYMLICQLARS